jgi:hypothetical protein
MVIGAVSNVSEEETRTMARIKIEDISVERELTDSELDKVAGGVLIGLSQPMLYPTISLYGSYSITSMPLSGLTVAGVRG